MIRVRSELVSLQRGRTKPFFSWDGDVKVPNRGSRRSNAALVQMQKRPRWPPGARSRRLRWFTFTHSTPGMLRKALIWEVRSAYTSSGPRRWTYRRFRILPLPRRTFRDAFTRSQSSSAPTRWSTAWATFVLSTLARESVSMTSGTSWTLSTRWPRAITRAGSADAARAEQTATRRWFRLVLRLQLRHTLVGANMRPPRHMFPKAPWPARCVPPPETRGIRATARPVPQDSADVCSPACFDTA
mmetsp:Transcript_13766/g.39155  ORF Transcript_13766/g.39155 Transcript_13766/m.39155 type:complete len:243 (+) Transcript_13766:322-1050(+)